MKIACCFTLWRMWLYLVSSPREICSHPQFTDREIGPRWLHRLLLSRQVASPLGFSSAEGRVPWNHRHNPLALAPGECFGKIIVRYMQRVADIRSRSHGSVSCNKLKSEKPSLQGRKRKLRKMVCCNPTSWGVCCFGVPETTLGFDDSLGLTELGKALLLGVTVYYRIQVKMSKAKVHRGQHPGETG